MTGEEKTIEDGFYWVRVRLEPEVARRTGGEWRVLGSEEPWVLPVEVLSGPIEVCGRFEPGSVVCLKSGGPLMTITSKVEPRGEGLPMAHCTFFHEGKASTLLVPTAALKAVKAVEEARGEDG